MKAPLPTALRRALPLCLAIVFASQVQAYVTVNFNTASLSTSRSDGALDGDSALADHWYSQNYNGAVGELGLNFADQASVSGVIGTPNGTYRGDSGDSHANQLGLFAYCLASDDPFPTGNASTSFTLRGYTAAEAESRFRSEVANYRNNALMRAAYLMDQYGLTAHNATTNADVMTAALQVAIWEVLYDATPNVTEGQGNYYVRTSEGTSGERSQARDIRDQANTYLNAASTANWGGAGYNPDSKVIVWMDPDNANDFQSVITLRPNLGVLQPVPEASVAIMALGAAGLMFRRRRAR